MTSRDEITALIDRVEKATGPDRGLDEIFAVRFAGFRTIVDRRYDGDVTNWFDGKRKAKLPAYTASLDAIVGLVGRELPHCVWAARTDFEGYCGASISTIRDTFHEQADTVSLALCAAFLRAKLSTLDAEVGK